MSCNQTYRLPAEVIGTIVVRSRRTGENAFDWINQAVGKSIFEGFDREMIEKMRRTPGIKCPSGPP
jgi:hypothetical protein